LQTIPPSRGCSEYHNLNPWKAEGEQKIKTEWARQLSFILLSDFVQYAVEVSFFEGKEISTLPAYKIVRLGISLAPRGRRIFSSLTVKENLKVPYKGSAQVHTEWNKERFLVSFLY
jgi:ABC-type lipopolysaccharide export system ATPase subunit